MKKIEKNEQPKHHPPIIIDRQKHDDDLGERMAGGIRTWSSFGGGHRCPFIKKHPS